MSIQPSMNGLSELEAEARRSAGQGNDVRLPTSRTYAQIIRTNIFNFFNIILFSISLLLLLLGDPKNAFFTGVIAFSNAVIASVQEVRAKRALDRIALLVHPQATIIRDGKERGVPPEQIVLGDLLAARRGDQVLADGVVLEGKAQVDESLLSGESEPITKNPGDRLLSGSYIVSGQVFYDARQVGEGIFANQLTLHARTYTTILTPLQRQVNLIIRGLLVLVAFYTLLIAISTFLYNDLTPLQALSEASVVLGLAPPGLFLIIVIAYAMGAVRIAGHGAVVQQANSIESLCHVDVMCMDKTGTLTTNRLKLEEVHPLEQSFLSQDDLHHILGRYTRSLTTPNPTSLAISESCEGEGLPLQAEIPFSSERRFSALSWNEPTLKGVYALGAPEALYPYLSMDYELGSTAEDHHNRGLRVLLLAGLPQPDYLQDAEGQARLPAGLQPLAFLTLRDELRPEAAEALAGFRKAGISVKIISGDHPRTVAALAHQVALDGSARTLTTLSGSDLDELDDDRLREMIEETVIFGLINPVQKKRLVQALRDAGHYVAMTGDGVNDVMALKQAHVGIALEAGSSAARAVSDIILLNNSFASLPHAFQEGRRILNGNLDVLRLFLVNILVQAFLIAAVSMLSAGFPFNPSLGTVLGVATVGFPSFFLALWAKPAPVSRTPVARQLFHFVLPASLITGLAGLFVYLLFLWLTDQSSYAMLTLTYALVYMGLLLVIFVCPPTHFWAAGHDYSGDWKPTILVFVLLVILILISQSPVLGPFLGFVPLASHWHMLVIMGVTLLWMGVLRFTWRKRLLERYFDIDLGKTTP